MRIAQIAPLYESVPPKYYGGTERIVSYLTEALIAQGHEVTLYASGDSRTQAQLRPGCRRSLRLDKNSVDSVADHVLLAERVFQESSQFDFVHSHIDYLPFPLFRRMETPHVTTLHGRLDIPNLYNLYREFSEMPLISISNAQRTPLSWANWQGTVHHGLPRDLYSLHETPGKYLAFLGRVSPEKRLDRAIEIAERSGMPLKIAAKVDKEDTEYYEAVIKPMIDRSPRVEFLGEISDAEKNDFLGNAYALLFPIEWPEPFGLVMIEAFACGTPVISSFCGSIPEIMEHGKTGYIIRSVEEGAEAVRQISKISRADCRRYFEERFTAERMASDYTDLYSRISERKRQQCEVIVLTGT